MQFYGLDCHSDNLKMVVFNEQGLLVKKAKVSLHTPRFKQWLESLSKEDSVALEASTNSFFLYDCILPHVQHCYVLNPHKLPEIYKSGVKTDYRDAERICERLWLAVKAGCTETERLPQVYVPSHTIRRLRKLFRSLENMKEQIVKNMNAIHAIVKNEGKTLQKKAIRLKNFRALVEKMDISECARTQIRLFLEIITAVEKSVRELEELILKSGVELEDEVRILTSITGVSNVGALAIMADIANIHRFPHYKNLCSYLRSAPGLDASNESVKVKGINKKSRKLAMKYIIQGIQHIKHANPKMEELYCRLRKGKSYGKSTVAVARHTIMHIYFMLRDKQYYHFRNASLHEKKIEQFQRIKKLAA